MPHPAPVSVRSFTVSASAAALLFGVSFSAEAGFKGKYYKACYAPVKAVEKLVAPPKKKKGGLFGGAGGLLGAVPGVGGAASALNTANTVMKYHDIITDVMAFTEQMRGDHPDATDRFAAYGDRMTAEAEDLNSVQLAVGEAQDCYNAAYAELGAQVASGDLKKSKAKKRHKEIRKGVKATGDVLLNALNRLNQNVSAYDQALTEETGSMGLDIGAITRIAGISRASGCGTITELHSQASMDCYRAGVVRANATARSPSAIAPASGGAFAMLGSLAGFAGQDNGGGTLAANLAQGAMATADAMQATDSQPAIGEEEAAAAALLPGLQRAGLSSQKYLKLHQAAEERAAAQHNLETMVQKRPF